MSKLRFLDVVNSVDSWKELASKKLKPRTAYRVMKYMKLVDEEIKLFEVQRNSLLRSAAGVNDESVAVRLEAGTDEYNKYLENVNDLLMVEVDICKIEMKFCELVEEIADEEISVGMLLSLEPFFAGDDDVETEENSC